MQPSYVHAGEGIYAQPQEVSMSPALYLLLVQLEGTPTRYIDVTESVTTIGRSLDNSLVLSHIYVSRHHAELRVTDDQLFIVDVGSTNGTFINGERIPSHEPRLLSSLTTVSIGPFQITVMDAALFAPVGAASPPGAGWDDDWEPTLDEGSAVYAPPTSIPPAMSAPPPLPIVDLAVDVALPSKATVNEVFDVAVLVRPPGLPVLEEPELDKLKSGEANVIWPEDQPYISLYIRIRAPDCIIHDTAERSFRLYSGRASPVLYFNLTPRKVGIIGIIVELYQEEDTIGSARVQTLASEQRVGAVEVNVVAQSLSEVRQARQLTAHMKVTDNEVPFKQLLLREKQRRLDKLELHRARKGYNVEPEVLTEMEDLEGGINDLLDELSLD
jgi:hypothetical protein